MKTEELYNFGEMAEGYWANMLRARGWHVDQGRPGKVMVPVNGKNLIAPDILAEKDGVKKWHEVKRKTQPGYRYLGRWRGWESGMDKHKFDDYRALYEQGHNIVVAILHDSIPFDDSIKDDWVKWHPPSPEIPRDWTDYRRFLRPCHEWRWTRIQDIIDNHHVEHDWTPKKEGILFPLSITRRLLTSATV